MDFSAALDTKASDIEKPPVLPQGTYVWEVKKIPAITQTKSGEWDVVEFQIGAVSAEPDVDEDDLAAFGSLASALNRISFMFPTDPSKEADVKRGLYRLKMFMLKTLRVDGDEDSSMKELMDASVGAQFLASATWRRDGDEVYVDVKNYAALD